MLFEFTIQIHLKLFPTFNIPLKMPLLEGNYRQFIMKLKCQQKK